MKDFLKYTFATITGIILSGFVFFLLGIFTLTSVLTLSEAPTIIKENSILNLRLSGTLNERLDENPFDILSELVGEEKRIYGLNDILSAIQKAKEEPNIKGIYLTTHSLNTSYASLQELRNALLDFKESGKFIVAYADNYTQGLYYLASAADKILLNPQGMIEWKGISANTLFYKNLLDKVGIDMQIFKAGTYKSAVEPFASTSMSEASKKQTSDLIHSIWQQLLKEVSTSRQLSIEQLNNYANRMLMFHPAEECIRFGLADSLMYLNDVSDYLKKIAHISSEEKLHNVELKDIRNLKYNYQTTSLPIIAVYYANGEITDISSSVGTESEIVGNKVIKELQKLAQDNQVKAVVMRINSPGGSAFASEQIWHAVQQLRKKKPVIVSMGDYAASGGYYIACAADSIVAQPTTLTGSIGVFGMIPNAEDFSHKIGLNYDVVQTNTHADFGNIMRPLNEDEKKLLQIQVERTYQTFIKRCAEGRHIPEDSIRQIAEGRVWSGEKALSIGLVDALGGIDTAIQIAAHKANLKIYESVTYPAPKAMIESFMQVTKPEYIKAKIMQEQLGFFYQPWNLLRNLTKRSMIQARIPKDIHLQ